MVVFPAPFALVDLALRVTKLEQDVESQSCHLPPIKSVREPAGRSREMFFRPVVPSGKANVRLVTVMLGLGGLAAIALCLLCWRLRS
jgi:hypothetical protein